jgi:capsular polysaccharide transport system permease protein
LDTQVNQVATPNKTTLGYKVVSKARKMSKLFVWTVVVPTIASILYFGLIASDVYVSESRFIVRAPQRQATVTGVGSLLQSAGFSSSNEDNYTVQDFMKSRDALEKVNESLPLKKVYGNSNVDIFNRFDAIGLNDSMEDLFVYYKNKINAVLDSKSSITTMTVRAYSAEDAYKINGMLLSLGEDLVNKLNSRGRQDMIGFALSEVKKAEDIAKNTSLALSDYRKKNSLFDPNKQSDLQLQQVAKLQSELINTNTSIEQLLEISPDNPQIKALRSKSETLKKEIALQMSKVAGDDSAFAAKSANYERLMLEREFADKQLAGALASLESARNDAQRKQLYLERIVNPNLPDVAIEPKRLTSIISTFVLCLIIWGVLTILIAGVKEHRD